MVSGIFSRLEHQRQWRTEHPEEYRASMTRCAEQKRTNGANRRQVERERMKRERVRMWLAGNNGSVFGKSWEGQI